jgi:hypothetical protein
MIDIELALCSHSRWGSAGLTPAFAYRIKVVVHDPDGVGCHKRAKLFFSIYNWTKVKGIIVNNHITQVV